MTAKTSDLKDILIEELQSKKAFDANWQTECDIGGEDIEEGEAFVFMGNKKKVCESCMGELIEIVEAL